MAAAVTEEYKPTSVLLTGGAVCLFNKYLIALSKFIILIIFTSYIFRDLLALMFCAYLFRSTPKLNGFALTS